ncbi:helix-turn-helix domain-containing protein [Hymenobacter weizhouensis]|uniref:helix-turn-helix domain-containing protein n=1 Tax=Hymenobacter sp. YIM 151500-1 TaxID=2987689 RepID=UPI002226BF26|nr:AraC family transcriptional regulator [Hymenobacter sp. YIM 151500-1]UYZ63800.1 helix-turn-helix transcriptional regulator [Hymenobacter sp. YIM 151500-1]
MHHLTTLAEYCRFINIAPPRDEHFDIRRFRDNMRTVNRQQPPFRHELYAVALRWQGTNRQVNGRPVSANLFFNTPYQLISWDIEADWEGWYILFDEDFARSTPAGAQLLTEFPFLSLDKSAPLDLPEAEARQLDLLFQQIWHEYHHNRPDRAAFLATYAHLALLHVRRQFSRQTPPAEPPTHENRAADVQLVARLQALLARSLVAPDATAAARHPSFYAEQLCFHPNHLNAVVKRITGKTTSQLVQEAVMTAAKSLLLSTTLSVKEVAYHLHFSEPTHFAGFFRKHAGLTPQQFREQAVGR